MSDFPTHTSPPTWNAVPSANAAPPRKTSGLAIASLVCSTTGLVACCTFALSIVGLVLGIASLGQIGRAERRGRGLAIGGIVLGVLGIILGVIVVVILVRTPESYPVPGREVAASDRNWLETMGVVNAGEQIDLLYSAGLLSIKSGGVVLTDKRLVIYSEGGKTEACALDAVRAIRFVPSGWFLDDGQFVVETDERTLLTFGIGATERGDKVFDDALRRRATQAREAAGKPPPAQADVEPPETE